MDGVPFSVLLRWAIALAAIVLIAMLVSLVGHSRSAAAVDAGFVAPTSGIELPVAWGDLGAQLVGHGVIDEAKLTEIYGGSMPRDQRALLVATTSRSLTITNENASYLLTALWALGLGNDEASLHGEMENPSYGGAGNFASTGGWTIADGEAMTHYGMHRFVTLTPAQEKMVDDIAEYIYRPCCDNSTHFPDCNHGMAMLGLIELMAAQGHTENEIYRAALAVNSYWFPSQYQTIAAYMARQGTAWKDVSPKEVLGKEYSSASGYAKIAAAMQPAQTGGPSCSVGA